MRGVFCFAGEALRAASLRVSCTDRRAAAQLLRPIQRQVRRRFLRRLQQRDRLLASTRSDSTGDPRSPSFYLPI